MIEHERGYMIVAFQNATDDYHACAALLAKSLKHWHPDISVCLLTNESCGDQIFDYEKVIDVDTSNSNWLVEHDWQVFYHSPYRETVKLEADMLLSGPIDHWWPLFRNNDVWISTGCRNYKNQTSTSRSYRQVFDKNLLSDVYNAITYWRFSRGAEQFFATVKNIFSNWPIIQQSYKGCNEQVPNTDLAYAIALQLLDKQVYTTPGLGPQIVHMKKDINSCLCPDWRKELTWEIQQGVFRINGHNQNGLVHYHFKDFAKTLENTYD
jgi:hypothetical protein